MRPFSVAGSAVRHAAGSAIEAALIVGVVGALAFAVTVATGNPVAAKDVRAGSATAPSLSVSMSGAAAARSSNSLTVNGKNFTPSSGGQMVILWVGYPDDYCGPDACHGFYAYPTVADDGTFSATYDNVLLQSGTGSVKGMQYNAQRDKWSTVAKTSYTNP